jgi:uncharacterized membrane protein
MLNLIFAIKFVHVLAAAAMFGTALAVALFMVLADRSGNVSVIAVTARFAVVVDLMVMIPALALQPISGFPLASAVGLTLGEFWIMLSLLIYALIVAGWLAVLVLEIRIRDLTQEAVLAGLPLPEAYFGMFRLYTVLVWPTLAAMILVFALMIWQPRMS